MSTNLSRDLTEHLRSKFADKRSQPQWSEVAHSVIQFLGVEAEYAVELEWDDWEAAGAKEPTSVYGWGTLEAAKASMEQNILNLSMVRQRILLRLATHTDHVVYSDWVVTTKESRAEAWAKILGNIPREGGGEEL